MVHSKKLAHFARKWRMIKAVATGGDDTCCGTTSVADKGHCAMNTAYGRRFVVLLAYLGSAVFAEHLRVSQEAFGFASDGRITLPCDAAVMEYVMCLLGRNASEEVERAF